MAKNTCETSNALNISLLKKHGFLKGVNWKGVITWAYDLYGKNNQIAITSYLNKPVQYFRVIYAHTSSDGVISNLDYRIQLTSTPCYFGGKRYWFICPLSKDGVPCNRRVGVLYMADKYFGCRKCYDLAYRSQQIDYSGKSYFFWKYSINKIEVIEEQEAALRVKYWHNTPTRKYKRVLKKAQELPSLEEYKRVITTILGTLY